MPLVISSNPPYLSPFSRYGQFFVQNEDFIVPLIYLTPNLKMFPLRCIIQILYTASLDTELIIQAKIFPCDQTLSHNTSVMDRRTTDR